MKIENDNLDNGYEQKGQTGKERGSGHYQTRPGLSAQEWIFARYEL